MKVVKRNLTLLEILIALSLISLVSWALLSLYNQIFTFNDRLEKISQTSSWRQSFQQRLMKIFSSLETEPPNCYTVEIGESLFPAFFFRFDNGIDSDPSFCKMIEAMIYLSKNKEISMISWSKDGKERREILCQRALSLSFLFFDSKLKIWETSWPKEKEEIPSIIKCIVEDQSLDKKEKNLSKIEFAFFPRESEIIDLEEKP